jgi:hypothetical protein
MRDFPAIVLDHSAGPRYIARLRVAGSHFASLRCPAMEMLL